MRCSKRSVEAPMGTVATIAGMFVFYVAGVASAANISWSVGDFNTSNLDLSGTIVQAVNFGSTSQLVTIGGNSANFVTSTSIIPFNGGFPNGPNDTAAGAPTYTNVVGNQPLINVVQSHSWKSLSAPGSQTVTLGGLFPGQSYNLQLFMHDARTTGCGGGVGGCGGTTQHFSDGNGNDSPSFARNSGTITIGTFTADATTQDFQVVGEVWDPSLSGYVLKTTAAGTVTASLNRGTGQLTITNSAAAPLGMIGYSVASAIGGLRQTSWLSVANNYDKPSAPTPGNASIDNNDAWTILTDPDSHTDLSEAELALSGPRDGGSLGVGQTLNLGNVWIKNPVEDVVVEVLRTDGSSFSIPLTYTGNGGAPFVSGDLNFNGAVDPADWTVYISNMLANLSAFSPAERYQRGDLNNDGVNNLQDLDLFIERYDAANGAGAFSLMAAGAVPEPSALLLLLVGCVAMAGRRFATRLPLRTVAGSLAISALMASTPAFAVVLNPVQTTGQDQDIFFEVGLAPGATGATGELGSRQFFEAGVFSETDNGVPRTLPSFTSAITGNTINFAFNPFEENNVVKLDSANVGPKTLTLSSPAPQSQIAIVLSGGSLATATEFAVVPYTINYVGGQMESGTVNVPDWGAAPAALTPTTEDLFNASRTTANATTWPVTSDNNTTAGRWSINVTEITPTNPNASVASITFGQPTLNNGNPLNSGDDVVIYGISGTGGGPVVPTQINLRVNTSTGQVAITNPTTTTFDLMGYEVTSAAGSLNPVGWNSLSDQNLDPADGPDVGTALGDGPGETWDEAGGASATGLGEGRLFGMTSLAEEAVLNIGNVYNTTINAQDLAFRLRTADGQLRTGTVEYITGPGGAIGDYNNNGIVDAADYTVWRDNFGSTVSMPNDSSPGSVTQEDFNVWKQNFGNTSGAGAAIGSSTTVPEPNAAVLLFSAATLLVSRFARGHRARVAPVARYAPALAFVTIACLAYAQTANANSWRDRNYRMGDHTGEHASASTVVGTGPGHVFPGHTLDDDGPGGAFDDLAPAGNPVHINVSVTGPNLAQVRPGAAAGSLGIVFDGTDDLLRTDRLNFPATSDSAIGGGGPLDYNGISDRGFQLWVYPDMAKQGTLQNVVLDTNQHGLRVNAAGNWAMRYNGADVNSTTPVAFNQWTHIMVVRPYGSSGPQGGSILYVDGVAVAAATGTYNQAQDFDLVIGADTGDDVTDFVGGDTANFFRGVLDDMNMFVIGEVTTGPNPPPGTYNFALGEDNAFIASELTGIAGDVDQNGQLNQGDVNALIDGWRTEKRVNNVRVGDLTTLANGDLNFDGITNLADVFQLHDALLGAGHAAGFDFSLLPGAGVPEPSAVALTAMLVVMLGGRLRGPARR